jgi:hypothetical protein
MKEKSRAGEFCPLGREKLFFSILFILIHPQRNAAYFETIASLPGFGMAPEGHLS